MLANIVRRPCLLAAVTALAVSIGCNTSPQAKEAAALQRGKSLLARKDYARALLQFKTAAQAKPSDAEPYYQMGLVYSGMGDLNSAATSFRQATELNPKHAEAQLKYSELLLTTRKKERIEEAAKRLQQVLTNTPGNAEANNTLAIAEWQLGHPEDAAARLEETLQKFPDNLKAAVSLAQMKLTTRDMSGAEDVLRKAAATAPKSPQAALALGQFYWLTKRLDKAEEEIRRALSLDPKSGPALAGLAAVQIAAHRMDEAEETYKRLSALPDSRYKDVHAVFLFQTGKRDPALAEFQKLAGQNPDDRNARNRLLAAYVAMGKMAEAHQLLENVLKKNPKDTDALFQRAELSLKSGNASAAESDLKRVLQFKADSAQAHFALGEVYRMEGQPRNQRQELNEALRLNPSLLGARLALTRNFFQTNDPKSALEVLDQAPEQQKRMAAVVVERNWGLFAAGNFKEMRAVLDQALKVTRFPELLIQDAVLKMHDGDYMGARVDADEVLSRAPEEVRAARILADSYAAQKQPEKGLQRLAELAAGHPQSAPLHNLLGEFEMANGKRVEARQAFEAAKAANPGFFQADMALANLDYQEKRSQEARGHLANVLQANPRNIPAILMLASIEGDAGNRDAAIARYRAALEIDPTNLFALNNLAWTLAKDKPDEALRYAQQAVEIAPDNATVEDTLGWIYYQKGIYRMAVDYLKNAVARESTPRRQFHLGMCYIKTGDRELGQKTLNAALLKDPNLLKTEQGW
jgi:Tfp pilus assembly protein PilF